MFKTKILKNVIICLLVVFATSGVSLFCINSIYNFNKNNNHVTEAYASNDIMSLTTWDFDGGHEVKKNSNFDSFSRYVISDCNGLQTFSQLVNWGTEEFSGKSVYLTNDIDCGGNNLNIGWWYQGGFLGAGAGNRYFKGNLFDGQNYTISNFVVPGTFYRETGFYKTADSCGLFSCIDSETTIQNLRLSNYSLALDSSSDYVSAGGIVGYLNGGKIQKCIVEDFSVSVDFSYLCLGGIFGVGYGTISNCLVKNVTVNQSKNTAGIGPADSPYCFDVEANSDGYMDVSYYIHPYYPTKASQITACVIANFNCDDDFAMTEYVKNCNEENGTPYYTDYGHDITYCKNKANDISGLSCSATGGDSGATWYYVSDYNNGYPYLRQFIKDWKTVNFEVGSGQGSVSMSSIVVPSSVTASKNGSFITVGQKISATPSTGYFFESWEGGVDGTLFIANFTTTPYTLTFANAKIWLNETNISPSETTFNVDHNTSISVSHRSGEGPLELTYSFVDLSGKNCSVVYDIPEGYNLINPGTVTNITSNRTITPVLELGNFKLTFKYSAGSYIKTGQFGGGNYFEDLVYTIRGGSSVKFDEYNLKFEIRDINLIFNNVSTVYYIQSSGVRYDGLKIKMGGKEVDISALDYITGDVEIMPIFVGNVTVTFGSVNGASIILSESQSRTITMELNSVIEANLSPDRKTLTYTKNNEELITYVVTDNFGSHDDYNVLFAGSVTVVNDMTITPEIKNVIYKVNFAKEDNMNVATMSELRVNYSPPGLGGLFPIFQPYTYEVKYGTTILFEYTNVNGILTYVYTLKDNDTIIAIITYEMKDSNYAMQFEFENGEIIAIKNGLDEIYDNGHEYKLTRDEGVETISPTFDFKRYGINLN